jgi:uncharacterized alpha-E superfamily protein
MLSRVAQHVYWMARYIERAEDTARLISVNANLLLDLPRTTDFGWEPLIFITASEALFYENYDQLDELSAIKFLLSDRENPGSILSSLSFAREDLRTTRDVVPREAWEQVNDLYLYVRNHLEMGMSRRGRYEFLKRITQGAQQVTGLLSGTMTHSAAYDFVRMGRNLERADMTTRILDVRSANLLIRQSQSQFQESEEQTQEQTLQELNPFENIQWMSVLKSMSAYQMYRQQVRLRVRGPDVLKFLLQDPQFPRTVYHCLSELERCLDKLPRNAAILDSIADLKQRLTTANVPELAREGLHEFIDNLQIGLGHIHEQISVTYFAH